MDRLFSWSSWYSAVLTLAAVSSIAVAVAMQLFVIQPRLDAGQYSDDQAAHLIEGQFAYAASLGGIAGLLIGVIIASRAASRKNIDSSWRRLNSISWPLAPSLVLALLCAGGSRFWCFGAFILLVYFMMVGASFVVLRAMRRDRPS